MAASQQYSFDYKKAIQLVNFFARNSPSQTIDKLKVVKLIWLTDRYHLRKYGKPITGDIYYAMSLGPVGSTVKDIAGFDDFLPDIERTYLQRYLRKVDPHKVKSINDIDSKVLSETEREALGFVLENFGTDTTSRLVSLSHQYPEWKKFEKEIESKKSSRELMSYMDFFDNSDIKNDKFKEDLEALKIGKELFEEDEVIMQALS